MFEAMGVDTGINIEKLIALREVIKEGLPAESLYGFTPNAGLPKCFYSGNA